MSRLEELTQRYCPDGVEYVKIEDVCKIKTPPCKIQTGSYQEIGRYPIIDQGQKQFAGYTDDEKATLADGEYILYGDHTCIVKYYNGRFAQGADGLKILTVQGNNTKYVFYAFCAYNLTNTEYKRHWTQAKEIEIPVPPMPVQEEIVRILDSFTELQAELQAELQKRKQQYNYYRDNLLSFSGRPDVKWMKLGDICIHICSGGTPARNRSDYFKGDIPWLRTQEVDWTDVYDTEIKITEEAIKNSSAKLIPTNCVIIAMYGATAGKTCINKIPLTTNQACCNLQINPQKALYKFAYYWICKEYDNIKSLGQGSQNNINAKIIRDYLIPIPPLAEQNRIVSILDRFDKLTNDLTTGLPAEIEKRQQQYEYYRDRLLTFKRKGA